jgi:hypothetical protein
MWTGTSAVAGFGAISAARSLRINPRTESLILKAMIVSLLLIWCTEFLDHPQHGARSGLFLRVQYRTERGVLHRALDFALDYVAPRHERYASQDSVQMLAREVAQVAR